MQTSATGASTISFTPATTSPHLSVRADGLPSTLPRVFEPTTPRRRRTGSGWSSPGRSRSLPRSGPRHRNARSASPPSRARPRSRSARRRATGSRSPAPAPAGRRRSAVRSTALRDARQATATATAWIGTVHDERPRHVHDAGRQGRARRLVHVRRDRPQRRRPRRPDDGLRGPRRELQGAGRAEGDDDRQRPASDPVHLDLRPDPRPGLAGVAGDGQGGAVRAVLRRLGGPCRTPVWTGTVVAAADGEYMTAGFTPTSPATTPTARRSRRPTSTGGADGVRQGRGDDPRRRAPGDHDPGQPAAGAGRLLDLRPLTVSGLGSLAVSVRVELWGPFTSAAAVKCTGTPFAVQTVAVTGDGTFRPGGDHHRGRHLHLPRVDPIRPAERRLHRRVRRVRRDGRDHVAAAADHDHDDRPRDASRPRTKTPTTPEAAKNRRSRSSSPRGSA